MATAKMIIMTIPAVDDQINLIKFARKLNSNILIIANAYHGLDSKILYNEGANFVMMPHYLGGEWISKILRRKNWNAKTLSQLKSKHYDFNSFLKN